MEKRGIWLLFALGGIFLVFLVTIAPQIYWRDCGEFVAVAFTLGIAHPAGSPLFIQLAKLFSFLPLGSLAFKMNLFSSIAAIGTIFFLYRIISLLGFSLFPLLRDHKLREVLSFLCALIFGLSLAFWRWSINAEVYSLQELMLSACLYFFISWRFGKSSTRAEMSREVSGRDNRFLFLVFFILFLSLGAHITNALFFPAFMIFLWVQGEPGQSIGCLAERGARALRDLAGIIFFSLLGMSIFLYLPLRAQTDTPLKLGMPGNLANFISHITGTRVMPEVMKSWGTSLQLLSWQAWSYWVNLVEQISILHIIFGLAGLIFLLRRDFKIALFMVWVFLINIVFFRDWDLAFGFLPSFLIYTIWAGVGFLIALNFIVYWGSEMHRPWAQKCLTIFLVGVLVISLGLHFGSNFKKNNLGGFYTAHTMGKNILDSLRPNAVIVSRYSIPHFLLWHLKYVEARRPDLLLVSQMEFTSDEILKRFIWSQKDNFNIYWTGNEKTALFPERLVPNGLVFRFDFDPSKDFISTGDFRHHMEYRRRFEADLLNDPYVEEEETYPQLYAISSELYYYYSLRDVRAEAEDEFRTLASMNRDSTISNLFYGIMLADKGDFTHAAQVLNNVYDLTPSIQRGTLFSYQYKPVVFALGLYSLEHKDYANAIKLLRHVKDADPFMFEAHYSLAIALERAGKYGEALREYEHCLLLKPDNKNARQKMNDIEQLLGEEGK
jgi:tetratricopeptide (TPR) repeat protein/uncharacterized membrane protein